jgi:hypothetical protein
MHTEFYCDEWPEFRVGVLYPAAGCYSHRLKHAPYYAYSEVLEPPRWCPKVLSSNHDTNKQ